MTAPGLRSIWCPLCGQVKIVQTEVTANRWRPLGCSQCLSVPLTSKAGGATVESDGSVARTRPMSAPQQAWVVFLALQEVRCGGFRQLSDGARRPCTQFIGTVNPGSVVKIRMRQPGSTLSTEPGGILQSCPNCRWRYELQTALAGAA